MSISNQTDYSARKISGLEQSFTNPPASSRPLAIVHAFERLVKSSPKTDSELRWAFPLSPAVLQGDSPVHGLRVLQDFGFGGVVTNVSWHNYLRDDDRWDAFLEGIRACKELGLRVWLYDEEGYPSGSAGGLVLREHPEFEGKVLVRSVTEVQPGAVQIRPPSGWLKTVCVLASSDGGTTDVTGFVGADGWLRWDADRAWGIERYDVQTAFEGTHLTNRQVHAVRRYINVIDAEAVKEFRRLTHLSYAEKMGEDFGSVEAFFTDEPLLLTAYFQPVPDTWKRALRIDDVPAVDFDRLPRLAWLEGFPELFRSRWGYDLTPLLGSLFAGESGMDHRVRHDFHQLVSELYADAFFGTIQDFLGQYGVALSGHVLFEEPILQHVATEGSLMANLRMMRKPGIDMYTSDPQRILNSQYWLTCKYGSSAAHICGRDDIMSESSDWVESCEGARVPTDQRRGALAIQAVLGITTFTNYYNWDGYPAQEVKSVMDFCGRLHEVVRSGTHVAPVAILYPIRTAWAHYLPTAEILTNETQAEPLRSLDDSLRAIGSRLLRSNLDFDFIDSEALVGASVERGRLRVARESYEMVILPPGAVLCSLELNQLRRFVEHGGSVLAFSPLCEISVEAPCDGAAEPLDTPYAAIRELARNASTRVQVFELGADWFDFVSASVDPVLKLSGDDGAVLVRKSLLQDGEVFLLVNTSSRQVEVNAVLEGKDAQVWNPSDGNREPFRGSLCIEPYGARGVVRAT